MFTDNYIVRIYRRNAENPQKLIGLVEIVETQEKKSFKNIDELREILNFKHKTKDAQKNNE